MEIVAAAYKIAALLPSEEKYGSLGSCFELETHCLVTIKLRLADEEHLSELLKMLEEEEKMLTAFIKTLTA